MLNGRIADVAGLRAALRAAEDILGAKPDDASWADVEDELRGLGFEPGWGRTLARIRDTLQLFSDILEAPESNTFGRFLSRVPMIF